MSYDERLRWCDRPEHPHGPSPEAWQRITTTSAPKRTACRAGAGTRERGFGRLPREGDAFCGGGSAPLEAARIGCEAYGWT